MLREYITLGGATIAIVDAGGMAFVHSDHLATPQVMTDGAAAVVWDASYRPFGEATIAGAAANDQRFPGQTADAETGYSDNWHRTYDPSLGRYLQSDPIGLSGDWNTYAYVGGNPVMLVDPAGLFNPAKGAVAIGNAFLSGFAFSSGMTKLLFGIGAIPAPPISAASVAWSLWNFNSEAASFKRAIIIWNEALCEEWGEASFQNVYGLLPKGNFYDDEGDAYSSPVDYVRKNGIWEIIADAGIF